VIARDSTLEEIVDLLCLVYHEARNVRHVIKKGLVGGEPYKALVNLPTNREEAWAAIEQVRREAVKAGSAGSAAAVFQRRFGRSLGDLEQLYRAPFWKNSAYGGNKWVPICSKVRELVEALDSGQTAQAGELRRSIPTMEHNTGLVREKLCRLKGSAGKGVP
jgi:hypothetical protein